MEDVKIKFYNMMVEYHSHDKEVWDICQCYYKIYETKTDSVSIDDTIYALQSCVIFLILSKSTIQTNDMLDRLKLVKDIENLTVYKYCLTLFTTKEIIPYPFNGLTDIIEKHTSLKKYGGNDLLLYYVKLIRIRIIEHNLRVVSDYYNRIQCSRLADILGLDQEELENHLSELVSSSDFYVKIDRPAAIISFKKPRAPEVVLTDWASDIGKMLNLMESTCHLINRENMVQNI
jgi:26S proteasome regulatory subunit N5